LLAPRAAVDGSDIVIPFTLATAAPVRLQVFDVRGALQRTLLSESLPAGSHVSAWDRTNAAGYRVARGVYWVRLLAGEAHASRTLVVTHP
jgi:flagellar hook assembly protein FlgD